MGRFSTTVQIRNNADRMRFVNSFCDVMKKRGFVPCSGDEAALSYLLAFGEGGWVTLTSEEYKNNPQKAYDDSRQMAETLKTSAFSVEVVDSDFALLMLCNSDGGGDKVVVGDGSGYGVDNADGTRALWEPLLMDGKTWEQFSEAAAKNEAFVEDTLAELSELLGIEPYSICADFDEGLNRADENENITALSFKKSAAKAKSMSLNAAFVKVFGEALEPLGFKKIECAHPYFLRIVEGEIIHVITYRKMNGHPIVGGWERQDYGQYDIVCKVETVYSSDISLPTNHLERDSSFLSRREIYVGEHIVDFDESCWKRANEYFPFKPGDEKQMLDSFEGALDITKQILLPVLDIAVDLNLYLEFIYKFGSSPLFLKYEQGNFDYFNEYDGLIHIKADTCDSYVERIEKQRKRQFDSHDEHNKRALKNDPEKLAYYFKIVDNDRKNFESKSRDRHCLAFEMFKDKEWCEKAFEELKRRKAANTEILRSYGLDI